MSDRYECGDALRALDTYVDGELDASTVLRVEQHLAGCADCAAAVVIGRAMKRTLRMEARAETAPVSLRGRLARSAEALRKSEELGVVSESQRANPVESSVGGQSRDVVAFAEPPSASGQGAPPTSRRPFRFSFSPALPLAAVATLAVAVGGGMRTLQKGTSTEPSASNYAAQAKILDELAVNHARPLPPEELDPLRVAKRFSPIVGVPVRPAALGLPPSPGWAFAGARLTTLSDDPTATLFYEGRTGIRVTVFVYDPARISVKAACCLQPKVFAKDGVPQTVLVGRARGYSVAVHEKDGVGHALSGDVEESELVALALGM